MRLTRLVKGRRWSFSRAGAAASVKHAVRVIFAAVLAASLFIQPLPVYASTTTISPNAAGDLTQLTASPAGSNYSRVQTNDGDGTYVRSANSDTYSTDLYNMADLALYGMINSVTVTMVARVTNTGQSSAYTVIKTHGAQYNGVAQSLTTSYSSRSTSYTTNPATGSSWTWAEINSLQAGVALRRTGGNRLSRCTQVYVTVDYSPTVIPTVDTGNATSVEETTATLHGTLSSDGGQPSGYRFEYDTDAGEPYAYSTAWSGNITSGQAFSANITGLSKGTKYYFRAQARNSAGTTNGTELNLLTKPEGPVPGSFAASTVNSTQIDLSWTKGEGALRTMVRAKEGNYPVDVNDGRQVYFDTGSSLSDTDLTPSTTYYYRAWSEVTGSEQWSDSYIEITATTSSAPPPPPPPNPIAVGGEIYAVNKLYVIASWTGMGLLSMLALTGAGSTLFLLRKKARAYIEKR